MRSRRQPLSAKILYVVAAALVLLGAREGDFPFSYGGGGCAISDTLMPFLVRTKAPSASFVNLPLAFEWNAGQADSRYQLLARGLGYTAFVAADALALNLRELGSTNAGSFEARLAGADPRAAFEVLDHLPGRINYLFGSDPEKWLTDIPTFARVRYRGVYPGIDLVYYGNQAQLEHDFVLAPGADPGRIQMALRNATRVEMESDGAIAVYAGTRKVRWETPLVYQESGGRRVAVQAKYKLIGADRFGFELAGYDRQRAVIIDPVITYSSYLGRTANEIGLRIATDASGNTYVTGMTTSIDYPATPGSVQTPPGGAALGDVFITKIDAAGARMIYSTHIGGSQRDLGAGIAVDAAGNVFVAGSTASDDFPVTAGAFRTRHGGIGIGDAALGDCFVAKLNDSGSRLIYSTFLGGSASDGCFGLAIDAAGSAYVTGAAGSANFPTTQGAMQPIYRGGGNQTYVQASDAFVAKFKPDGSDLVYSTLFGAGGDEFGMGIAVDGSGNAHITGFTNSPNLPLTAAAQGVYGGAGGQDNASLGDAFVLKLNAGGSQALYSTYLGGRQDDVGMAIALDDQGNAYVGGSSLSKNFPTRNALQAAFSGSGGGTVRITGDGFLAKLSPAGAIAFSTYLGGSLDDEITGVAVDRDGNIWLTGATLSTNFRTSGDARQAAYRGAGTTGALRTGDAFLTQLNNAGSAVVYSTYLGGADDDSGWAVTVDTRSNVYVAGSTASLDFPTMSGSLQPGYGNGSGRSFPFGDAFVVRFGEPARMAVSGVASAASYAGGGVAPGEIIFFTGNGIGPQSVATLVLDANGRVSPSLAGVRVLFDGVPAPVIYVSSGQGSVIVPYSVAGKPTTQMVVEYEGNRSAALTLNVQPAKPALFSATQTGRGQGAILNQDFGYNSAQNPASKGSYVMLYGTGEGQTNPPGVDGSVAAAAPFPRPVGAVSVKIGGLDANLIYAGAAPGQIAGLFQINAQIPEGVASGDQPVVVTIGTASSQPGLTVAVR